MAILLLHPRPIGGPILHQGLREVWLPVSFFRALAIPLAPAWGLTAIEVIYLTALALALLGLFTRTSCAVACIVGLYLLGLPHNMGKINHDSGVVPFLLLILAVARSGDAWSIDAIIRRRRARSTGIAPPPIPAGEYRWPVRMVWLLTSWVFLAAAWSKLSTSGLAWVTSDSMSNTLLMHAYLGDAPSHAALWLSQQKGLCHAMAAVALASEAAVPLAMFSATLRALIIPALALTLLGFMLLGFTPVPFFALLAFWVPWDRLAYALSAEHGLPPASQ
jgi:hypothetical protein